MRAITAVLGALALLVGARAAAQEPGMGLFQFLAFSAEDLEVAVGPIWNLHGRLHANGDLYLNSTFSLVIGDDPANGAYAVQVSAGGNVVRGRKNVSLCDGSVQIDTLLDAVPPSGDLDPRILPCLGPMPRIVPSAELAAWGGTLAADSPYANVPPPDIIAVGGPYWDYADLRIVLRADTVPPHAIEVQHADGTPDVPRTAQLHAFMADEAWNRGSVPGAGPSSLPGTAPIFYTDVPLATPGCGCSDAAPICGSTDPACYSPPFGTPLAALPPFAADTSRVYGRNIFDGDARRGGFYNFRERRWMLLLNVNVADLLRWNAAHGEPFFAADDATHGGLALFLTVHGPADAGINNYGVRVFGAANLPLPGGIGAVPDPTGLTVVSDQALYALGDYNRGPVQAGDLPRQPAALIGDTINLLSNRYWDPACNGLRCRDGQSVLEANSQPRRAAATRVNAALLGGLDRTALGDYNGGLENFPRLHEHWTDTALRLRGSFVSLGPPAHANGRWCGTGNSCNIYNPPLRDWNFDVAFDLDANLPPLTPRLTCGNGTVDSGETCDDGNHAPGDCCAPTCHFEPPTVTCADDANTCTRDACDGAGSCTHLAGHAGAVCRPAAGECDIAEQCDGIASTCPADSVAAAGSACTDDGEACSADHCDGAGACVHPPLPAGSECRARNGVCDLAEQCDGATTSCPPDAQAAPGTPCPDDGMPCTADRCDGAGTCVHAPGNAGTPCRAAAAACDAVETCDGMAAACPPDLPAADGQPCDDGDACTADDACHAGSCDGGAPLSCDDGDPCTRDGCDTGGGCTHVAAPALTCRSPRSAAFQLRQRNGASTRLRWKWSRGEATAVEELGAPRSETAYALCVYDATRLVLRADVPPDAARWQPLGARGLRYRDASGAAAGVQKMVLVGGDAGRARMTITGGGAALPDPDLGSGLAAPVTVQLHRADAELCWAETFGAADVTRHDAGLFKAKRTR